MPQIKKCLWMGVIAISLDGLQPSEFVVESLWQRPFCTAFKAATAFFEVISGNAGEETFCLRKKHLPYTTVG